MNAYEEYERMVNPHRAEEQRAAAVALRERLRARGITLGPSDREADLLRLQDAVEAVEAALRTHGGT